MTQKAQNLKSINRKKGRAKNYSIHKYDQSLF